MEGTRRFECSRPAGELLPGEEFDIGMRVIAPAAGSPPARTVFYCLPGGMMDRTFFDLGEDDAQLFSFAEVMARHGLVTITADHPGIGQSTCPRDEYELTPDLLARAHVVAARSAVEALHAGTLAPGLEAMPDAVPVGCGHSMGAITMIDRQARDPFFSALVLLGYGFGGLPSSLPSEVVEAARDIDWLYANIGKIARDRFGCARFLAQSRAEGEPPPGGDKVSPEVRTGARKDDGPDFHSGAADPVGRAMLRDAAAPLLTLPGMLSTFPGISDRASADIDVPILVVSGTHDFAHVGERLRRQFPKAPAFEHFAPEDTGHNLFIFASRAATFARIADWVADLPPG